MVLGARWFPVILKQGTEEGPPGFPHALETSFGFIVMGIAPAIEVGEVGRTLCAITNEPATETCGHSKSTSRDSHGRYTVSFPSHKDPHILGNSLASTKNRFFSLEKRSQSSPSINQDYNNGFTIDRRYSTQDIRSILPGYFIPHHANTREDNSSIEKRIVLDASKINS
jgi:hypothetical protein